MSLESKAKHLMRKYGVDEIDSQDYDLVKRICMDLSCYGVDKFNFAFCTKSEENLKVANLNAIIQQNFIIIRQLDAISKKLDKLIDEK